MEKIRETSPNNRTHRGGFLDAHLFRRPPQTISLQKEWVYHPSPTTTSMTIPTIKEKYRHIRERMSSPVSRNLTGVDLVKNQTTFSQDDEIDEEMEAQNFPITLIELLNDLEYGHKRHAAVVPAMKSRKSYNDSKETSGSGPDELSRHIRRLRPSCPTEPKKNGSVYKNGVRSNWTVEPTNLSSRPLNDSNNELPADDDVFNAIIEPDFTNFASSKEDESSSDDSQAPVFMGWCGIMMCTQNDSIVDHSPSDDEDDERSWKKTDYKKRRFFGRRHLLKDDDCIYMTNEASASLHNSLTLSSHYRASGKKKCKLLNELSVRANHYQVGALQAPPDPSALSENMAENERQLSADDTQHIVGCMRKDMCMYTNGLRDFKEDFCVVPEDFKSFDQIGDQQDSTKEERPTFETILIQSKKRDHETLVLSGHQDLGDDVELTVNPHPSESSGEEGIPFPRSLDALKKWRDMSIFSGPMARLKEIIGGDGHSKWHSLPLQINTTMNCTSHAVISPSKGQSGPSKGQEVLLEAHDHICNSDHGMRRQRTIDFPAKRNSVTVEPDLLSEATDVVSIDCFTDENNEDIVPTLPSNSQQITYSKSKKTYGDYSKSTSFNSSRFSLESSSKPLVLLMDGLTLSNDNRKHGPMGSGDTSICNNLSSIGKKVPDDTLQYLLTESYDSEPEPQVSGFVDDDSDEESLIDYQALEQQQIHHVLNCQKVAPPRQ